MKKYIIAVLALVLVLACKKDGAEGRALLAGKWELRQSAGGIAGTINYKPGTGYTIEFFNNGQYRFIYPAYVSALPRSGPYTIKKSSRSGNWLLQWQYTLNNQILNQQDSIRFEGSSLIFLPSADCCDIPTTSYERVP